MTLLSKPSQDYPSETYVDTTYRCPNCENVGMRVFYRLKRVPIHSCQMLRTEEEALAYPCRSLALGFCEACGFISNVLFDPDVVKYDPTYEDRQTFSPRFRAYQSNLIDRLVQQYDLRSKDILEIGCGPGAFLQALCRMGRNRGVGIDPRCEPHTKGNVRFINERLNEGHAALPMHFVCCRHTLEHIHPTRQFIALLRTIIGERRDTHVFFEVPDTWRILRDRAFWDIYYEHCSYFTPTSLTRLFESCGFEIVELEREFEDQYLLLVARPAEMGSGSAHVEPSDIASLAGEVNAFIHDVGGAVRLWRSRVRRWQQDQQHIAIWGAGSKCVAFVTSVRAAGAVETVVDINPHHQGMFLPGTGHRIMGPEHLGERHPDVVLVMNPIYLEEIKHQLSRMGIHAQVCVV